MNFQKSNKYNINDFNTIIKAITDTYFVTFYKNKTL